MHDVETVFFYFNYLEHLESIAETLRHISIDHIATFYVLWPFAVATHASLSLIWFATANTSLVTRNTIFEVVDQVRYKLGWSTTEDGWRLEISDLGRIEIALSM